MRKLWTDHVVWTRDYIIAAVGDQPDAQAAANRLMKNQEDIGNAVATFYGAPAGQQLTTLLKEHITIAVDLIKAAKAGDKSRATAGRQPVAAERRADRGLPEQGQSQLAERDAVDMMKKHLSTTTDEVVARLNKDWDADVRAFDAVYEHILQMSDALSEGIVKQFPEKFGLRRNRSDRQALRTQLAAAEIRGQPRPFLESAASVRRRRSELPAEHRHAEAITLRQLTARASRWTRWTRKFECF